MIKGRIRHQVGQPRQARVISPNDNAAGKSRLLLLAVGRGPPRRGTWAASRSCGAGSFFSFPPALVRSGTACTERPDTTAAENREKNRQKPSTHSEHKRLQRRSWQPHSSISSAGCGERHAAACTGRNNMPKRAGACYVPQCSSKNRGRSQRKNLSRRPDGHSAQ